MAAALRIARYAEALYAAIAVGLALGLRLPPRGPDTVLFAHWIGTALLAAAICVRLGRPNRQTWYIAALLSGYVLLNALTAILRLVGPDAETLGRPAAIALVVGALLWVTQIVVAVCLYYARELRTMPSRIQSGR
jgi:energy-converting hydrogenase Eha subunit A